MAPAASTTTIPTCEGLGQIPGVGGVLGALFPGTGMGPQRSSKLHTKVSVLERDVWFYLLGARTGLGVESGFSGVFSQVWKQCKGKAEKAQTCPRGWDPGGVLSDGDVEACLRVLRHMGAFLTGPPGKSERLGGLVGTLLQGARMSQLLCPESPLISSGPARGREVTLDQGSCGDECSGFTTDTAAAKPSVTPSSIAEAHPASGPTLGW